MNDSLSCIRHVFPAILAGVMLSSGAAKAVEQGDWVVRAGFAWVGPTETSSVFSGAAGARVDVDSAKGFAFNVGYMATKNLALEILGAAPFTHDIIGKGAISGAGKVAETKQLPPTLLLQYHFLPSSWVHPYLGAGVTMTLFFDTKTTAALPAGTKLDIDRVFGVSGQAGVDAVVFDKWLVNAAAYYMDIDTTATLSGGLGDARLTIDPWVLFVGVGRIF